MLNFRKRECPHTHMLFLRVEHACWCGLLSCMKSVFCKQYLEVSKHVFSTSQCCDHRHALPYLAVEQLLKKAILFSKWSLLSFVWGEKLRLLSSDVMRLGKPHVFSVYFPSARGTDLSLLHR